MKRQPFPRRLYKVFKASITRKRRSCGLISNLSVILEASWLIEKDNYMLRE